jgi:hypothetical protein
MEDVKGHQELGKPRVLEVSEGIRRVMTMGGERSLERRDARWSIGESWKFLDVDS